MPLNVLQEAPKIRPSRSSRWRWTVLALVHVLIAAHIAHWLITGSTVSPVEPSEAAALAHQGVLNTGLIFFAAAILLTAVFGRFFCGWACHLLALQDASAWLLGKLGRRPKPLRSRLLRYVPLVIALYVFVWPLAYRLWLERGLPPLHVELTTSDFWATFPGWVIGLLTFLVCGFGIVYFLGAKGFCTYACPYGAFFAAADRLSPMRIRVTDACQGCGHCTAVCTSNVRVHEEVRDFGMVVDDGCMKCLDCVSVCPNDALFYGSGPLPGAAARKPRRFARPDLTWQEEFVLGVAFVVAFVTSRGLYGSVPLLMALGMAAILAYLSLIGFQLLTRPHLKLKGLRLKRQGRWLPGGRVLGIGLLLLATVWGHSALVHYHARIGATALGSVRSLQVHFLNPAASPATLSTEQRQRLERGSEHLRWVGEWGLVPTAGAASQRAWISALTGRYEAADRFAVEALRRRELVAQMHMLRGQLALQSGSPAQATERYREAIEFDPGGVDGYLGLGLAHVRTGDMAAAALAFEAGLNKSPRAIDLAYNAAVAHASAGDVQRALPYFEHTLTLQPEHLAARENLAGLLASLGRFDESVDHYRWLVERQPEQLHLWMALEATLRSAGRLEEASDAAATVERLR